MKDLKEMEVENCHFWFCLCVVALIFILETAYRQPLHDYSIQMLIPYLQSSEWKFNFFQLLDEIGGGYELLTYFLLKIIISGKYHRAFLLSIFIALNFFISNLLQLLYRDPRPFWIEDNNIKVYVCSKGFANPCGHSISIAMFASFWAYEFKQYGIVFGFIAVVFFSLGRLILGVNTLNQVIFGLSIGFWLSYMILFTVDYKLRITRHF